MRRTNDRCIGCSVHVTWLRTSHHKGIAKTFNDGRVLCLECLESEAVEYEYDSTLSDY